MSEELYCLAQYGELTGCRSLDTTAGACHFGLDIVFTSVFCDIGNSSKVSIFTLCVQDQELASCNTITHNTHPTHHPQAAMSLIPLLFALVGLPALAMAAPEIVSDGTKVQLMAPQGDIEVCASPRPIANYTPSFVSPRGGRG